MADEIAPLSVLVFVGHVERSPRAGSESLITMGLGEFAALEVELFDAGAV